MFYRDTTPLRLTCGTRKSGTCHCERVCMTMDKNLLEIKEGDFEENFYTEINQLTLFVAKTSLPLHIWLNAQDNTTSFFWDPPNLFLS